MKQIFPDLWQTKTERPYFGVTSHAYLLVRPAGNILFYGTGAMSELGSIRELGGITRHYLSHRHEAGSSLVKIKREFGSQLCCHTLEAEAIRSICPVEETFDAREIHLGDIEVIPTPGHTAGSTCYVYKSPHGKTYLFTGDTIFPKGESWGTLIFQSEGGGRAYLKTSLARLRDLEPDTVISSAAVGHSPINELSGHEWQTIIDKALDELK